jgi:hypothetical protein
MALRAALLEEISVSASPSKADLPSSPAKDKCRVGDSRWWSHCPGAPEIQILAV